MPEFQNIDSPKDYKENKNTRNDIARQQTNRHRQEDQTAGEHEKNVTD